MTALQNLLLAYSISTIFFLLCTIFSPHFRDAKPAYLSTANISAAIIASLLATYLLIDLRNAWQSDTEHTFYRYRTHIFLRIIFALFSTSLLTLSAKLRRTVLFTSLLIAIYSICLFYEFIYLYVSRFFIDTLPSSWAYYYDYPDLLILIYPVGYFIICYIIATKILKSSTK